MIPEITFLRIIRSAVKAPSGHNTQPWMFAKEDECICIEPDFDRALPVADPDNRELFISLGCAAETAMIASKFYGYNPTLIVESLGGSHKIKIKLTKAENISQSGLFPFINSRQTTRNLYNKTSIPVEDLEELRAMPTENGVNIRFFYDENDIRQFIPFMVQANVIQMSNPEFIKELIQWMRFSEREAVQKGDGLYTACSGIPAMGQILGSFVLKNILTAKSVNIRLRKQLENSSALALFTTSDNDVEDWVKTGMVFQRFALTATKLGLMHSFINSPCQINQVSKKMANELGLHGDLPQLLVRLGYSPKMPFSFRRRIHSSISD